MEINNIWKKAILSRENFLIKKLLTRYEYDYEIRIIINNLIKINPIYQIIYKIIKK